MYDPTARCLYGVWSARAKVGRCINWELCQDGGRALLCCTVVQAARWCEVGRIAGERGAEVGSTAPQAPLLARRTGAAGRRAVLGDAPPPPPRRLPAAALTHSLPCPAPLSPALPQEVHPEYGHLVSFAKAAELPPLPVDSDQEELCIRDLLQWQGADVRTPQKLPQASVSAA